MQKRIEEKHYKIVEICKNTGKKFKGKVLVFPNESQLKFRLYCPHPVHYINQVISQKTLNQPMEQRPRRSIVKQSRPVSVSTSNEPSSNDVSFSIPDWKQQEIKSINEQYQKQIYSAVPLSLTDFDSKEEVEFLSPPEKCNDERYAYERNLVHKQDFSILAFILCLEQILIGDTKRQAERLQKFKKKINQLDLCCVKNIPTKMKCYYDNKILKKILFQYINKGSYNVSLLQVLLRRNSVLKFSLSLVSRAILKKRSIIELYTDQVPAYIEMRNCGDQFGVLSTIKVKEKFIQTENFLINIQNQRIKMFRKQNVVKIAQQNEKLQAKKRPLTPQSKFQRSSSKLVSRKSTKETASSKQQQEQRRLLNIREQKGMKRSSSLADFFRKLICF